MTEAGPPLFVTGPSYEQSNSSVSIVQEEGEEVWSDAHDMVDEEHGVQVDDRTDNEELDEEDRIRSTSAPGIDSQKFKEAEAKSAATGLITTSLERTSSNMASPVDSESHILSSGNSEYNRPPPAQSNPELNNNATASAPRSTQSLDVFQQFSNDRATSPTPTYNSSGVDRRNSRRRSVADVRHLS